jgi:serine/threonine-protein kinase
MPVVVGQLLAGRYEIEQEIGRGGMAAVYAARDRQTNGAVAVKVMHPSLGDLLGVERFMREIRVTSTLRHPGIVPLLDTGEVDGQPYYTMPLVRGETLAQRLQREQHIPLEETIAIAQELLDALAHAHEMGITHRDIKPANILLSGGRAVLADFGIAKAMEGNDERLTSSGLAIGTSEYMSPEQASADRVDHRSDIYSLGCVIYEMLAGGPPFSGTSAQAIRARHLQESMPGIRVVRPTVTRKLEAVVAKALAKVPADRYANARAFQEALRDPALLLPDSEVAAASPVTPARSVRAGARWAAGVGVVLAVAAMAWWRGSFDRVRPLDAHRVVGFPLIARADGASGARVGEDVSTLIGSALDRRESLRWIDGWRELGATATGGAAGESGDAVSDEVMQRIARRVGARWYLTGRIVTRGDSSDVLLELVDVQGDSVAVRPRASGLQRELWRVAIRSVNQILPVLVPGTDARDLERAWVDRDPGAVASFLAGEAAFRRARPGEALAHYREATRIDSAFALAAVRAAQAATADHRPEEARQLVRRAANLPMPAQYAEFTRGYLAYLEGRPDSAVAAFRRALKLDADLTAAWAQLGESYVHLVGPDSAREALALQAFDEARSRDTVATHLLLHPLEMAWRRGDTTRARAYTARFLAARPDSSQAETVRLIAECASKGAKAVRWEDAMRSPLSVLSAAAIMGASRLLESCALAAYGAVRTMDTLRIGVTDTDVTARRQAAQIGELALLAAQGRYRDAMQAIDRAVARGEGGSSLLMFAAAADSAFAGSAMAVAAADAARFGADNARCSSAERCWILAAYHAQLGHVNEARGAANAPLLKADTGLPPYYAMAARAHATLAAGDSAAARAQFRALLDRPFPPGALLTWNPVSGFGLERLVLARLYVAQGQPGQALALLATLDAPGPVVFPLFRRAAEGVRTQALRAPR